MAFYGVGRPGPHLEYQIYNEGKPCNLPPAHSFTRELGVDSLLAASEAGGATNVRLHEFGISDETGDLGRLSVD